MKNAKKNKHLSFEDRCVIEEFLNNKYNFTKIANRIHKDRTTVAREVLKHRFLRSKLSSTDEACCFENKPPYVCNACPKFNNCHKQRYSYSHDVAYNEYKQTLIKERSHLKVTKEQVATEFYSFDGQKFSSLEEAIARNEEIVMQMDKPKTI